MALTPSLDALGGVFDGDVGVAERMRGHLGLAMRSPLVVDIESICTNCMDKRDLCKCDKRRDEKS